MAACLVGLLALRMVAAVGAAPVFGFANNLDFVRESACTGVWEDFTGRDRVSPHLSGPERRLIHDGVTLPDLCLASSDNLFAAAAGRMAGRGFMDLRLIGALRAVAALAAGAMVLKTAASGRLGVALAVFLVLTLGDAAVLASFNTLYADASILCPLALFMALACALAAKPERNTWGEAAGAAALLLWLGLAKLQFLWAPAALAAGFFSFAPRRARFACLAAAVLAPLLFAALNQHAGGLLRAMADRNIEDSVMATIIPAAPAPAAALHSLGLPDRCMAAIGLNGYEARATGRLPCPEVDRMSRLRLLALLTSQPEALLQPLLLGTRASQTTLDVLPHFERLRDAGRWRFGILRATSLSTWIGAVPARIWPAVLSLIFTASLFCAFLPRLAPAPRCLCALAVAAGLYTIGSAIFGDGVVELSRHELPILIAIAAALTGTALAVAGGPETPRDDAASAPVPTGKIPQLQRLRLKSR